jgi:hypothetical protein
MLGNPLLNHKVPMVGMVLQVHQLKNLTDQLRTGP